MAGGLPTSPAHKVLCDQDEQPWQPQACAHTHTRVRHVLHSQPMFMVVGTNTKETIASGVSDKPRGPCRAHLHTYANHNACLPLPIVTVEDTQPPTPPACQRAAPASTPSHACPGALTEACSP